MPTRILVLERYGSLTRRLTGLFPEEEFAVHVSPATDSILGRLPAFQADLVVLWLDAPPDWQMLRKVRAQARAPVIVCSTSDQSADIVRSLELGAEDYVRASIPAAELGARIYACLRRMAWAATRASHH